MAAEENKKRNRKANFTVAECSVILEEAEKNIDVIKSKFSNAITNKEKTEVWRSITSKVNSLGVCERSVQEIKDKWRGMVGEAKKEHCQVKKKQKMTGGGSRPKSPNASTQKIIDLFGENPSFSGISGGLESSFGKCFCVNVITNKCQNVTNTKAVLCFSIFISIQSIKTYQTKDQLAKQFGLNLYAVYQEVLLKLFCDST